MQVIHAATDGDIKVQNLTDGQVISGSDPLFLESELLCISFGLHIMPCAVNLKQSGNSRLSAKRASGSHFPALHCTSA